MTVFIIVLLVLAALIFGVGAVVEGLLWLLLIGLVLIVAAIWFGWSKFRRAT